jgi:hypothetical protein
MGGCMMRLYPMFKNMLEAGKPFCTMRQGEAEFRIRAMFQQALPPCRGAGLTQEAGMVLCL